MRRNRRVENSAAKTRVMGGSMCLSFMPRFFSGSSLGTSSRQDQSCRVKKRGIYFLARSKRGFPQEDISKM